MPALFMTSLPQGNQPKPPKGKVRYPNEITITTILWSWNPDRSRSLGATGKADDADDDDKGNNNKKAKHTSDSDSKHRSQTN